MEDIMKMVKSLEESELLIKGISETIKNEALPGRTVIRAGEEITGQVIRACQNF